MDRDAMARLIERAARDIEDAESALRGQAGYLREIADGLLDETIHPDHLPVVGNRIVGIKEQVERALAECEQHLYLAH